MRSARVTEPRHRIALERRLVSQVLLKRVVAVNAVIPGKVVAHITGPLIDIHRRRSGASEGRYAISGRFGDCSVLARNEIQQFLDGRVGDLRSIEVTKDAAKDRDSLPLASRFVGSQEESFVLFNGTAEIGPELIALEG